MEKFARFFDRDSNTYFINDRRLVVTLQDVIFQCHFPITSKAVLIDSFANNNDVFVRVFGQEPPKKLDVKFLAKIRIAHHTFQSI